MRPGWLVFAAVSRVPGALNGPEHAIVDRAGNVLAVDTYNLRVRRIAPNGGTSFLGLDL